MKKTAFISYQHSSSKQLAHDIRLRLRAAGIDVYSDEDLIAGEDVLQKPRHELNWRTYYIVILSPTTLINPEGVRSELEIALKRNKPIIPVFINGYKPADLPDAFASVRQRKGLFYDGTNLESVIQQIEGAMQIESQRERFNDLTKLARRVLSIIVTVLVLLLTFLALFSEEWRNDAFYKIGVYTATPDLTATQAITQTALAAFPTATDFPPTPTASVQPDMTATAAMLQLTIDTRETENALLTQNTQTTAQTRTAAAPTTTHTPYTAVPLTPGQQARVLVTGEALRSGPSILEAVIEYLPEDAITVAILGGPSVSDEMIWWHVRIESGDLTGAEGWMVDRKHPAESGQQVLEPIATTSTSTPVPPTNTTVPTAVSTPGTQIAAIIDTSGTIMLTIYRDEDSFTLYVPQSSAPVSLVGLEFRVGLSGGEQIIRRLDTDFSGFLSLPFDNISSLGTVCFRLVRANRASPLPQDCQSNVLLLTQQLASADVFWRDARAGLDRTVLVYRDDELIGACGPEPSCTVNWPSN